jgi:rRNA-processing protein EBP2
MKAVDARKKAQHNRKYQKEIQDVRREERLKSKKAAVEAVKTWRSKEGRPNVGGTLDNERELFDIHLENTERDMKGKSADGKKRKRESGPRKQKSKKRQALDKKYGLGGRPRAKKRNSAESSSDMSGYFRHHNAGQGGKGKKNKFGHGRKGGKEAKGGKGARKRPGKNARRR